MIETKYVPLDAMKFVMTMILCTDLNNDAAKELLHVFLIWKMNSMPA